MYSIKPRITDSNDDSYERVIELKEIKKAKGVKSCVLKNEIEFGDYYKNSTTITKSQNTFRTKLHKMYTIKQTKTMFSPFDDKRHILFCEGCESKECMACAYETYAHGHYKLRERRPRLPFGEGSSTQEDY